MRIEDKIFQAPKGSYIWKPRNVPHTFWNAGLALARLIEFIAPAGLENYFVELAGNLQYKPPDLANIAELAARFDLMDVGLEWVPELNAKYNRKLAGE